MSIDTDIYAAFAQRLTTFAANLSPVLTVAYPGITFTPPDEGMWLELAWFPNRTQNYGIPTDGPSLHRGFGQVSACDRPGHGTVPVSLLADAIIAHFGKGTILAGGSVYEKPSASTVLVADDRIVIPVTVRYSAFVNG